MKNLKHLSVALAALGLLLATLLIGWYGFGRVADTILSVGPAGFALLCIWQIAVFAVLGLAWAAVAPVGRIPPFVWGRMVRDGASNCLPFSQVGGFVMGARAVTLHGVAWPVAVVSTIIDLTAEFVSEILFAAAGLVFLFARSPRLPLSLPLSIGLGATLIVAGILFSVRRRMAPLLTRFGRRLLEQWFGTDERRAKMQAELAEAYAKSRRIAAGILLHLIGWVAKGVGNWIAYRLLGADIGLPAALAIEGLLHAALAAAFLVPAYAGVQEAAYAAIGSLFGAPPEISLGVSLLRRSRDIALGIPVLLIWQLVELRRVRTTARSDTA